MVLTFINIILSQKEKQSTGFYYLEQALNCIEQLWNESELVEFILEKAISDETFFILGYKGLFLSLSSCLEGLLFNSIFVIV